MVIIFYPCTLPVGYTSGLQKGAITRQVVRSGDTFCVDTGGRAARGEGQIVELGAVNRLPDGDPAIIPTCHRYPRNPTADRKAYGCLGGQPP